MAAIVPRKRRYAVVYYSRKEDGTKRQVWESFETREEAQRRKDQVEYLQRYNLPGYAHGHGKDRAV